MRLVVVFALLLAGVVLTIAPLGDLIAADGREADLSGAGHGWRNDFRHQS